MDDVNMWIGDFRDGNIHTVYDKNGAALTSRNGEENVFPVILSEDEWDTYTTVIKTPESNVHNETLAPVLRYGRGWKYNPTPNSDFALDAFYYGEAVLTDVEFDSSVADTVTIPAAEGDIAELPLGATFKNQLGNTLGLDIDGLTWSTAIPYIGVTIENGKLKVDDNAYTGDIYLVAKAKPFASSTNEAAFFKKITLQASASADALLPRAKNVTIIGDVINGTNLTADYKYYQVNREPEGATDIKWYMADDINGLNEQFVVSGETFPVNTDHLTKIIYYKITPKTIGGASGNTVKSAVVAAPTAPTATVNPLVSDGYIGGKITGTYIYNDINDINTSLEGVTTFKWHRASDKNGPYSEISGAISDEYTITDADVDKYIKLEVIPTSTAQPYTNSERFFSEPIPAAARAAVSDININHVNSGIYSVSYKYNHVLGIKEGDTKILWSADGVNLGEGVSVTLTGDYSVLSVTVIPYAEKAPLEGVEGSASYTIKSGGGVSYKPSHGGGGGGGGYVSKKPVTVPIPEQPKIEDEVEVENVPVKHWAEDGISFVKEKGIMQDLAQNDFKNSQLVTRAELVSYIIKALGETESAYLHEFGDVTGADYYAGALQKAVDLGIISRDTKFYPDRYVSRQEVCKILVTAAQVSSTPDDLTKFSDGADIAEWAKEYVGLAVSSGLLIGVSENEFMPLGNITREQTAVIIKRFCDKVNGGK